MIRKPSLFKRTEMPEYYYMNCPNCESNIYFHKNFKKKLKLSLNRILHSAKNELFHLFVLWAFLLTEWSTISLILS